tara:strand:- start:171 stop:395 length:225 start_codon:yes stop_codon:yes gene_type:complete
MYNRRHNNETKGNKMKYTMYKKLRTKHTDNGTRYMVKCYTTGKYAITAWVGATIGGIVAQGDLDYIIEQWNKLV